ncbi:hypothetical protein [Halostreptopolyspora alba]|uniref:Uncharacterized protein n=1 Tax=Halostreptopolyspora alba TaxID=2487137 RepID=A0A3N0EBS4_9ACTN|nr:hypothetical protein EFW17_09360 [Nocardiopsaceae bacterium YIM 96095]
MVEETGEGEGRALPWRVVDLGITYVHDLVEDREAAHGGATLPWGGVGLTTAVVPEGRIPP